jgi:hypothetical protein
MAFKIGSTTVITDGALHQSASTPQTGQQVNPTGFKNASGTDIADGYRVSVYQDQLNNCRGIVPQGYQSQGWTAPNGNWWTWAPAVINVLPPTYRNQGNPGRNCNGSYQPYDIPSQFANAQAISPSYVYDAYSELTNQVKQTNWGRGYGHCNCNCANCLYNCNCNCNC